MPDVQPEVVTTEFLADRWNVSRATVCNWIREKRLAAQFLTERTIRVPMSAVLEFEQKVLSRPKVG